jgi:hypothetical protein
MPFFTTYKPVRDVELQTNQRPKLDKIAKRRRRQNTIENKRH